MVDPNRGYARERFPDLKGDSFDCGICYLLCREPKECFKCGAMYCTYCIDDWISKRNECPIGCADAKANIKPVTGALAKIYRNLDIKCELPNCRKVVKLCELAQHEAICQLPKCEFFVVCGNSIKPDTTLEGVCDDVCLLLKKIKDSNGNWIAVYEAVKNLPPKAKAALPQQEHVTMKDSSTITSFGWDVATIGRGINISNNKKTVYLKENGYMFRTVIGDKPMTGGIHYWEIHADKRSENELKIGVVLSKEFNLDTSFSDYEFGYAYYGLGQLRHNSNSVGTPFGKKFKKEGVLGVCLNMNKGTLSFALNGDYWGVAYQNDALKRGQIYAAVSLLHQAGFTLETGKPVPTYFLKN